MLCICSEENLTDLGFEVVIVVTMKSTIFWDVTPCIAVGH
jgi:hypothetical protein